MLEFHPVQEHATSPTRQVELLLEFKAVLEGQGMADMDEYGDMLNWGLPQKDGMSRSLHVFDPGFCSFSDAHYGTIHYHGGQIRGTILAGNMIHDTYQAQSDPAGDRFYDGNAYRLEKHSRQHGTGTTYTLPAMVPHWLKPTELTLTYFEEEDNGKMGDLVNPDTTQTDEYLWEQADADALLPRLHAIIDARIARLAPITA